MLAGAGTLMSGTLEHLRRPLARNIKEGQQVLVLSDTEHDPRVWQAIMTILADLKADATLMLFSRRPADYYDPPRAVCEAMLKSDVNVLVSAPACCIAPQVSARWRPAFPQFASTAACVSNGCSQAQSPKTCARWRCASIMSARTCSAPTLRNVA